MEPKRCYMKHVSVSRGYGRVFTLMLALRVTPQAALLDADSGISRFRTGGLGALVVVSSSPDLIDSRRWGQPIVN